MTKSIVKTNNFYDILKDALNTQEFKTLINKYSSNISDEQVLFMHLHLVIFILKNNKNIEDAIKIVEQLIKNKETRLKIIKLYYHKFNLDSKSLSNLILDH